MEGHTNGSANSEANFTVQYFQSIWFAPQHVRQVELLHTIDGSCSIAIMLFVLFSMALFRVRIGLQSIPAVSLLVSLLMMNFFFFLGSLISYGDNLFVDHPALCRFQGVGSFYFFTTTYTWTLLVAFRRFVCAYKTVSTRSTKNTHRNNSFVCVFLVPQRIQTMLVIGTIIVGWGFPGVLAAILLATDNIVSLGAGYALLLTQSADPMVNSFFSQLLGRLHRSPTVSLVDPRTARTESTPSRCVRDDDLY